MKHTSTEELKRVADVYPERLRDTVMSRAERLARWAELLEAEPARRLNTLHETEFQLGARQSELRADDSPITVAFSDPFLRAAGLKNDTYGEAKRFFEITDWQLHDILCYCHYGVSMTAATAARGVRAALAGTQTPSIFSRMRQVMAR
jgi:hypothetical protein